MAFTANIGYGSWDDQYASDEMEYTLDGVDFRQEEERQSENNFLSPQFSLKYTNQLPGKYVFQARFSQVMISILNRPIPGLPLFRMA